MRYLSIILLLLAFGCKEAETYEKEVSVSAEHAGQYLYRVEGKHDPNVTERYVLAVGGQAERHTLSRSGRFSEYHLDKIVRGRWFEADSSLVVILEAPGDSIRESYRQTLRYPDPSDSTRLDSIWADDTGQSLQRLIRFR